jgi:hypothetical protein
VSCASLTSSSDNEPIHDAQGKFVVRTSYSFLYSDMVRRLCRRDSSPLDVSGPSVVNHAFGHLAFPFPSSYIYDM